MTDSFDRIMQGLKEVAEHARGAEVPAQNRLTRALLETADEMRRVGVMDAATHEKITLRHPGDAAPAAPTKSPSEEGR